MSNLLASIGPFFENGIIRIGSYTMQEMVLASLIESLLMFAFFLLATGKLRLQQGFKAASNK